MDNKILVKIYSPELGESYDVFIPVNEYISVVSKLVASVISKITGVETFVNKKYLFMNKKTLQVYDNKAIVRDTDIKNSTELVLL
ncbi:MAG: hypothetical protein J6A52_01495 [Bacilli bacterium]|nr:hypothetical protein [Bacilli bacterium]